MGTMIWRGTEAPAWIAGGDWRARVCHPALETNRAALLISRTA